MDYIYDMIITKSIYNTRAKHLHQRIVIETMFYTRERKNNFLYYYWGICVKVYKYEGGLPQRKGTLHQRTLHFDLT